MSQRHTTMLPRAYCTTHRTSALTLPHNVQTWSQAVLRALNAVSSERRRTCMQGSVVGLHVQLVTCWYAKRQLPFACCSRLPMASAVIVAAPLGCRMTECAAWEQDTEMRRLGLRDRLGPREEQLTESLAVKRNTTPPQKMRSETDVAMRCHHHACHHRLGCFGCNSSISSSDSCRRQQRRSGGRIAETATCSTLCCTAKTWNEKAPNTHFCFCMLFCIDCGGHT
jgi:hypothetical protein